MLQRTFAAENAVALQLRSDGIYAETLRIIVTAQNGREQVGLVFEQDLPSAPLFIRADESEIMRAIDKLVGNACKFIPQDGTVRVELSQQDGQAIISVVDTGIDIPDAELPQLFNRFHRGRNTTVYPGSGLGLAIVKAIVVAHVGHVEGQSAGEGRGSKFSISLPVVPPENL